MTTATMTSRQAQPPIQDSHQQQKQQQQHAYVPQHRHHVQHIGNYVIHRKTLGSGSMGTVKLAECLSDKDHQQVCYDATESHVLRVLKVPRNSML